jgi:hypothetical protein
VPREGSGQNSIFVEFGGPEFVANTAIRHDVKSMTGPYKLGQIRRDDNHRSAVCSQKMNEPVDFGFCTDVDTARRFVEDQYLTSFC